MGKHLIFLIHGVGSYTKKVTDAAGNVTFKIDQAGWFKSCEDQLIEIFDKVIKPSDPDAWRSAKFDDFFKVVPILYDDIFETYRNAWAKQAGTWNTLRIKANDAVAGDQDLISGIGGFLRRADQDSFGWANVADVVMYQSFTIGQTVVNTVQKQVLKAIADEKPRKFSFIAHSMGTRVLHDVWEALAKDAAIRAKAISTGSGLSIVCMLSNVVQALSSKGDVASIALQPKFRDDPRGWSAPDIYINANHRYDLISLIQPMARPTDWQPIGYYDLSNLKLVFNLDAVDSDRDLKWDDIWAPHQFNNYMLQPELAMLLWQALMEKGDQWAKNTKPKFEAFTATKRELISSEQEKIRRRIADEFAKQLKPSGINLKAVASFIRAFA